MEIKSLSENRVWPDDIPVMVTIVVATYNHENFIEEAIESFLIQEVNFRVEILINDDASTDSTAAIIKKYEKKYPGLFRNFYQAENQYSKGIKPWVNVLFPAAAGKYIALCEGDDYWIDTLKLQKQVSFLEKNTDFGICWSSYKILENNKLEEPSLLKGFFKNNEEEINFDNFGSPYCTYTLTCLFESRLVQEEDLTNYKYFKDNALYFLCLEKSKGAILNFTGGVYRVHQVGVYSSGAPNFQSYSNFTNYSELLKKIPKSRVQNIIRKKRYWQSEYYKHLNEQPVSKIKKIFKKFKYFTEFYY